MSEKTFIDSKESVWWLGLRTQKQTLVANCPQCIQERVNPRRPSVSEELPLRPWQKTVLDLLKCDEMVFTDYRLLLKILRSTHTALFY